MTLPPKCSITLAVDIHVNAGTMASSSIPKPNAASERCRAVVHDVTAIECFEPVNVEN